MDLDLSERRWFLLPRLEWTGEPISHNLECQWAKSFLGFSVYLDFDSDLCDLLFCIACITLQSPAFDWTDELSQRTQLPGPNDMVLSAEPSHLTLAYFLPENWNAKSFVTEIQYLHGLRFLLSKCRWHRKSHISTLILSTEARTPSYSRYSYVSTFFLIIFLAHKNNFL